jgi:ribokinase
MHKDTNEAPRIVVVGSSNTDLIVNTPHIPVRGETLLGGKFSVAHGGKGANQAVAAARLGAHVSFVGCIGEDDFGEQAINALRNEGIDTSAVRRTGNHPSGVAFIVVADDGENSIVVAPGSNGQVTSEDVDAAKDMIHSADVVLTQLEVPVPAVIHALNLGRRSGTITILNPAPAADIGANTIELVDWMTPNETEAAYLTGNVVDSRDSAVAASERLRSDGARNVLVTLGAAGSIGCTSDGIVEVPSLHVDAQDTVGAGDAYNGAFAVAIGQRRPLGEAMRFASQVAAYSVCRRGAQPSLPHLAELTQFLREYETNLQENH